MKFLYSNLLLCFLISTNIAQPANPDSGIFIIHKFAQAIGKEKYAILRNRALIRYNIDFKYTDRGSPVRLTDSISFTSEMEPRSYRIRGATCMGE
jgi:hypothetical protein